MVVGAMTGRTAQAVQPDLFGVDHLVPAQRTAAGSGLTDLDLVTSVVKAADDPGYVLIGPADKVHLYDGRAKDTVEAVPAYEADAVTQLLASGHLTVGGHHHVRCGEHDGPARSVLVPKATRALVHRWSALRPLTAVSPRPRSAPAGTGKPLWCPECGEPAVARPPTRWTTGNGPRPRHSHADGEPLCPVMTATGYRPARAITRAPG